MKQIRFLSLLLAVLLLLTLFSGCGKRGVTLDDLPETDELVICLPESMERYITYDYIRPYYDLYRNVRVRLVIVPGEYDSAEYEDRVTSELVAGDGPDVLLLQYLRHTDLEKAAWNHSFYDVTDLLASDPEVSEEDCVDGVFDAVRIDGRLYTVPMTYRAPIYLSSGDKLDRLDFHWDEIKKTSDFMEEMARLTPAAAERDEAFLQMMESKNRFYELFRASGIRLLDYGKRAVLPDEAAFHDLFEGYRAYFPYDYDASGEIDSWNIRHEALIRGDFLFFSANHFHNGLIWDINDMESAGVPAVFHTIPSQTGETVGQIYTQLAINANSKNVLNAWRFIRLLLSEEIQTRTDFDSLMDDVPVNKNAVRNIVFGLSPAYPKNLYWSEEDKEALYERFIGMDRFTWKTASPVYDAMWEAMLPYLQGEKSYDDCVSELKTKLNFYISE